MTVLSTVELAIDRIQSIKRTNETNLFLSSGLSILDLCVFWWVLITRSHNDDTFEIVYDACDGVYMVSDTARKFHYSPSVHLRVKNIEAVGVGR